MASSSSSTPSSQPPKKYDVFISFSGADTRSTFTSHLCYALRKNHIEVYIDQRLEKGDEVPSSLEKAIQDSTLFLVIFSKYYASSTWCLEELTKILERSKNQGGLVMPVFYRVDPSHVRKQSGSYQKAFEEHEHRSINKQQLQKWREALTHVANLSGWHCSFDRDDEAELMKEIVKHIIQKLGPVYQSESYLKHLVGIHKRMTDVESLLYKGSNNDVRFIGIWGMGGIGKTTLAKALFHKLHFAYEGFCFLANVREESKKYGIDVLREKLILKLLGGKESYIGMLGAIYPYAMSRLGRKKFFIVLDDVDDHQQLENLARRHEFGPGTKILITTRNKQVLGKEVDGIYKLKALNSDEALELFSINAFRIDYADPEERQLAIEATQYAYGNPLALKVLGSFLYGKNQEAWRSALDKLQKLPSPGIIDILKLSFEGLDYEEKNIFLDIACFFSDYYVEDVKKLLDACGYSTAIALISLKNKALLDIYERKISMHCLIKEMGQQIIREESLNEPEKRSRLWHSNEISEILKENKGSVAIEGIALDVSVFKEMCSNPQAMSSMPNLKFLILHENFKDELPTWPRGAIVPKMTSESAEQHAIRTTEIHLVQDVSRLMRILDFLHLILSYPMRIGYEDILMHWINHVYRLRFADDDPDFDSLRRRVEQLLSESPLRYVQVLIPKEIMNGGSVSSEATLKQVPQPMLLLATHLALHQLTHTLTSHTILYRFLLEFKIIQNIWFSTRNDAEKQTVVANILANSRIRAAFDDLEIIDLNQIDDETERELVLLNPATWPEQTTSAKSLTKNYGNDKCLFLVVDGDGEKKLDPQKVSSIKGHSQHVVVFITSAQKNDELSKKVDLTIKTEDHLLPWDVFCKIVGSELLHSSNAIQRIAVKIVEKCGGHLLATILMAQSLKHVNDVRDWVTALGKLCYRDREAIVNAFFNIIKADVISEREKVRLIRCLMVFKFPDVIMSYDQLLARLISEQLVHTEDEAKIILQNFLECSVLLRFEGPRGGHILLHEDIKIILHAFEQDIPENLSEGALESTISDLQVLNLSYTHMRNLYVVNALPHLKELNLEGCMLETLPEAIFKLQKLETLSLEDCLQLLELPPLIIKLENLKTLKLGGCKQLKTLPQEIWELRNLEVCDLSGTHITHLPQFLNLPKLISLLLGDNLNLMKISSSIFDHVSLLSILNLSRTSIHELPSSIFNLHGLKEFYLKDCELFVELPPEIRQLKNLETLDLDGTLITHLTKEIQELTDLKSLSLSFFNDSSRAVIPLGVLSKLTHLEVLRIGVNSDNEWWLENVEHILAEINGGLKMLRALDMYIPKVNFSNPIKWCLSNFKFIIGHHKPRMISHAQSNIEVMFKESDPSLKFVNGQDFPDEVKSILSEARAFFLDRHLKINNLTQFGLKNLKQLRLCILRECNEMQSIVDMNEYEAASDLKESLRMQFLIILYMKNLRSIVNKPIHGHPIFCELKLLALHTCPELTTIFTMDSLGSLVNLEELIVEDCPNVKSIISCSSSEPTTDFFLPRLRKLSLLFVPELASISNRVCIGRNLEQMGLYYCPKLQSFSPAELSSKKLMQIRGESKWWKALQWSEAEWGQKDPSHKFNQIFYPIDGDRGLLARLTTYELSSFNREIDSGLPGWKPKA